jgi:hypothetical protein
MSSSHSNLIELFWIAFQVVEALLFLWIALLVFRSRTTAAWITLISAILSPLLALAGYLWLHLAIRNMSSGMDQHIEVSQAFFLGYGVACLAGFVGVLLHLQRRKLESDRIAELEAILHDLQQRQADAPSHPPR